jgi:uncharacterized protein YndB with AHSA1/START domain
MTTMTAQTTQVYEIFIRATPDAIWQAITRPEFTQQYFFGSHVTVDAESYRGLDAGGGELVIGPVFEFEPPHRLVHGWRALYDPETATEDESRVTWEIEAKDGGTSLLRVVHDQLEGAPKTAASVAGGWMWVLSGLKTLLETGAPLAS